MQTEMKITLSDLKARGWTDGMVRKLAPVPELVTNPRYRSAAKMKLFSLRQIERIEKTKRFHSLKSKRGAAKQEAEELIAKKLLCGEKILVCDARRAGLKTQNEWLTAGLCPRSSESPVVAREKSFFRKSQLEACCTVDFAKTILKKVPVSDCEQFQLDKDVFVRRSDLIDDPEYLARQEEAERKLEQEKLAWETLLLDPLDEHSAVTRGSQVLFRLNRAAKKHSMKSKIYSMKNAWIKLLCDRGHCIAIEKHLQSVPEKECWACCGNGYVSCRECRKCNGTGCYRPEESLVLACFSFSVHGQAYSWHQPLALVPVSMLPALTPMPERDWSPRENQEPVYCDVASAIAFLTKCMSMLDPKTLQ